MKTPLAVLALAAALAAGPARAQFEGRLEYRFGRMPGKVEEGGAATLWIAPAGARTEMTMKVKSKDGPPRDLHFVSLFRRSEPNRTYLVSDERKAYAVLETSPERADSQKWTVERTGSGSVAGYACDKARVTRGGETNSEICVTRALGKVPLSALQADHGDRGLFAALVKAGLEGVPVRWASFDHDGKEETSMELVSAHRERVPASRFEVPAGYQKSSAGALYMTPEQQKQAAEGMKRMQERMKDMPPEQRKQIEELMKQYGGAGAK